jgi:phage-related protein
MPARPRGKVLMTAITPINFTKADQPKVWVLAECDNWTRFGQKFLFRQRKLLQINGVVWHGRDEGGASQLNVLV